MSRALYDDLGRSYTTHRRPDPRIAARIRTALGDVRTVVNVGAGTGAYEPDDVELVAVEPSQTMIAQRPPGAAPVVRAGAEALPFADASFDAAMAIISDHHWADRAAGLRELRRVARSRVVLVNADPATAASFWFTAVYLPEFLDLAPAARRIPGAWERELRDAFGDGLRVETIPIPHDCSDGFYPAYWRRPEAYLDPGVRNNISIFHLLDPQAVDRAVADLGRDLADGSWVARHADLLELDELDVGMRLAVATQ
jgi:SAM-dependent methyltransferase